MNNDGWKILFVQRAENIQGGWGVEKTNRILPLYLRSNNDLLQKLRGTMRRRNMTCIGRKKKLWTLKVDVNQPRQKKKIINLCHHIKKTKIWATSSILIKRTSTFFRSIKKLQNKNNIVILVVHFPKTTIASQIPKTAKKGYRGSRLYSWLFSFNF